MQLAKDNVLTNTACPGLILTDRVDQVTKNMAEAQAITQDEALPITCCPCRWGALANRQNSPI